MGVNSGQIGTKELSRKYPAVSGIIAETTKQEGRVSNLVAEHSLLTEEEKKRML